MVFPAGVVLGALLAQAPPAAPLPVTAGSTEAAAQAAVAAPSSGMTESGNDEFGDMTMSGFSIRTLTQVRYAGTFTAAGADPDSKATAQDNDGWRLNRMFLRLVAAPNKRLQARVLVDFAELMRKSGKRSLKLAYGELRPTKWLEITAGLFKRRFSLLELLPIADFEFGDVGPTDGFLKDLGYAGRDVGAMIRVSPLAQRHLLSVWVGAFAGDPEEGYDTTVGKLLSARVESKPLPILRLGADMAWRTGASVGHEKFPDYETETMVLDKGKAFSADATLALAGFELRLEGMLGDRTDAYWRDNHAKFLSTWGIATYRFPFAGVTLMPALRAEWLDADSDHGGDGRLYLTAGLNIDFSENIRLLIDVSRYDVQAGARALNERPWPMPRSGPDVDVRVADVDWWAVIAQLQLKI
jgi:hypothetical protein